MKKLDKKTKQAIRDHDMMSLFFSQHAMHHYRISQELKGPNNAVRVDKKGRLHVDLKKLKKRMRK